MSEYLFKLIKIISINSNHLITKAKYDSKNIIIDSIFYQFLEKKFVI
jgi:uncharacterized protein YrrD